MKKNKLFSITSIGLMGALVYVSSLISIDIPLALGNTRLHLGNVFCLLSGMLLGPVGGGLSAGIGSFFFDVTNPKYITSAPFTFIFKFLLAFVCGKVAYAKNSDGLKLNYNLTGGILGSITYIILYSTRNFIENLLLGTEMQTAVILTVQKASVSFVNGLIAVVVAVPLGLALRKALDLNNINPRQWK